MERLDARRDAVRREAAAIGRVERAGRARCAASAAGPAVAAEDVERGPDGGVADRVDLRRDAGRGGRRGELGQRLGRSSSRRRGAARAGAAASGSGSMSASSAAVRDPSEPSAKSFCQPIRARPSGSLAEHVAAAQPARDRRVQAVVAEGRVDADRQVGAVGERGVGRERERQVRVGGERAGVVARDDAERTQLVPATVTMVGLEVRRGPAAGRWTVTRRVADS